MANQLTGSPSQTWKDSTRGVSGARQDVATWNDGRVNHHNLSNYIYVYICIYIVYIRYFPEWMVWYQYFFFYFERFQLPQWLRPYSLSQAAPGSGTAMGSFMKMPEALKRIDYKYLQYQNHWTKCISTAYPSELITFLIQTNDWMILTNDYN